VTIYLHLNHALNAKSKSLLLYIHEKESIRLFFSSPLALMYGYFLNDLNCARESNNGLEKETKYEKMSRANKLDVVVGGAPTSSKNRGEGRRYSAV